MFLVFLNSDHYLQQYNKKNIYFLIFEYLNLYYWYNILRNTNIILAVE